MIKFNTLLDVGNCLNYMQANMVEKSEFAKRRMYQEDADIILNTVMNPSILNNFSERELLATFKEIRILFLTYANLENQNLNIDLLKYQRVLKQFF